MNIFIDFHHAGLARALWYLFGDRLNHQVRFPGISFVEAIRDRAPLGTWNPAIPTWTETMGGIDPARYAETGGTIGQDEFLGTDWDLIVVSRPESQGVFFGLHPNDANLRYMGVAGNELTVYDWSRVKYLLSTEESSYMECPADIPKILTGQELGRQYGGPFVAPTEDALRRVHSYINNMPGYEPIVTVGGNDWGGACPHCRRRGPQPLRSVSMLDLWTWVRERMPEYRFEPYGHFNEPLGGVCVEERHLPAIYRSAAVTLHLKHFEGWGHSVLQSIACGRPAIVPTRFFRYRTAGRYLIPGVTCYETELTPEAVEATIREATQDLDYAAHAAARCTMAAATLFNWPHEAQRVQRWMERNGIK